MTKKFYLGFFSIPYELTLKTEGFGTATDLSNPGGGLFEYNDNATVQMTPLNGHSFKHFTWGGSGAVGFENQFSNNLDVGDIVYDLNDTAKLEELDITKAGHYSIVEVNNLAQLVPVEFNSTNELWEEDQASDNYHRQERILVI